MATEKTAEGIRKFAADIVRLEKFVAENSGNERPAAMMAATVEIAMAQNRDVTIKAAGVVALNDSLNDGF